MKTRLLYFFAAIMLAALALTACSDDKDDPTPNYFQVDGGDKIAIKWAATQNLTPGDDEGYSIALCPVVPASNPFDEQVAVKFDMPMEDMGRKMDLVPTGVYDPITWMWGIYVELDGELYSTWESIKIEEATITGGHLKVTRDGSKNSFTIDFSTTLSNGKVVTGKYKGALELSDLLM